MNSGLFTFKKCTQIGSDSVHTFNAACLVILCAFLKSKQTILSFIDFRVVLENENSPNFMYNDVSTLAMDLLYAIGAWPPQPATPHSFIKTFKII